jgi:hypothetical protein
MSESSFAFLDDLAPSTEQVAAKTISELIFSAFVKDFGHGNRFRTRGICNWVVLVSPKSARRSEDVQPGQLQIPDFDPKITKFDVRMRVGMCCDHDRFLRHVAVVPKRNAALLVAKTRSGGEAGFRIPDEFAEDRKVQVGFALEVERGEAKIGIYERRKNGDEKLVEETGTFQTGFSGSDFVKVKLKKLKKYVAVIDVMADSEVLLGLGYLRRLKR